jgi:tetratricopeptide (TPR) repeat protein
LLNLGLLTGEAEETVHLHRLVHAFVQAVVQDSTALGAVEQVVSTHAKDINQAGYPSKMQPFLVHLRWMTHQAVLREDRMMANLYAGLSYRLNAMGDYAGARPLYERALAIQEKALGASHPDTATSLNNLAGLLYTMGDYAEAQPLYERALAIYEQELGVNHPDTARSLNNLALLLYDTEEYSGALPLYERALAIYEQALGPDHPDTIAIRRNLAALNAAAQGSPRTDQAHPAHASDQELDDPAPPQS